MSRDFPQLRCPEGVAKREGGHALTPLTLPRFAARGGLNVRKKTNRYTGTTCKIIGACSGIPFQSDSRRWKIGDAVRVPPHLVARDGFSVLSGRLVAFSPAGRRGPCFAIT